MELQSIPENENFFGELKESGKGANTLKNYRTDLHFFQKFMYEKEALDFFSFIQSKKTIRNFEEFLLQSYPSPNSRRRRLQTLRIFCDFLIRKGYLKENPFTIIAPSPKVIDPPIPSTLTEAASLWFYLINEQVQTKREDLINRRNRIIFLLIYGSALKVSELCQLKKEQILLKKSPRILMYKKDKDPYTIPLLPQFENEYDQYILLLNEFIFEMKDEDYNNEILFNSNAFKLKSGGLSPRGIELIFKDYSKKLNLSITAKSLRQSCIYRWLSQETSESQIKEYLGLSPYYSLTPYRKLMKDYLFSDSFLDQKKSTFH